MFIRGDDAFMYADAMRADDDALGKTEILAGSLHLLDSSLVEK